MSSKKQRVAVVYGGKSGEHEVSLRSAASVLEHLDRERFEIFPIGIDRDGCWRPGDLKLIEEHLDRGLEIDSSVLPVHLPTRWNEGPTEVLEVNEGKVSSKGQFDVVFPVMHGPLCEDGSIQGLLEMSNLPYVGSGVLGSAVSMDKEVAKRLIAQAGLNTTPFVSLRSERWKRDWASVEKQVEDLGLPVFVKPANMGSSVGIHKVSSLSDLKSAIQDAFLYDTKVIVEKGVFAREIELAVLDSKDPGQSPRVSVPGEIVANHEFYSYESKYIDDQGAEGTIPAKLSEEQTLEAQELAVKIFQTLECAGFARVDLFLDEKTNQLLFNEVNTLPGFTSISMYPKMWEASGLSYRDLLTELVDLAILRHKRRSRLKRTWK